MCAHVHRTAVLTAMSYGGADVVAGASVERENAKRIRKGRRPLIACDEGCGREFLLWPVAPRDA